MRKQDADRSHEAESEDKAGKGTHGDDEEGFLWMMSILPGHQMWEQPMQRLSEGLEAEVCPGCRFRLLPNLPSRALTLVVHR